MSPGGVFYEGWTCKCGSFPEICLVLYLCNYVQVQGALCIEINISSYICHFLSLNIHKFKYPCVCVFLFVCLCTRTRAQHNTYGKNSIHYNSTHKY